MMRVSGWVWKFREQGFEVKGEALGKDSGLGIGAYSFVLLVDQDSGKNQRFVDGNDVTGLGVR